MKIKNSYIVLTEKIVARLLDIMSIVDPRGWCEFPQKCEFISGWNHSAFTGTKQCSEYGNNGGTDKEHVD